MYPAAAPLLFSLLFVAARAEQYPYNTQMSHYSRWGSISIQGVDGRVIVPTTSVTAVTEHFAYTLSPTNVIQAWWIQARGDMNWTSVTIAGLNTSQPILSTPTSGSGGDAIYFLNTADGRIYCFNALGGGFGQQPIWASSFICGFSNSQQLMGVQNNVLTARCNNTIVVLDARTGTSTAVVKKSAVPLLQPIPFLRGRVAGWQGSKLTSSSVSTGKTIWTRSLPGGARIMSVAADGNLAIVTVADSPVMYVLNANTGQVFANLTLQLFNATYPAGEITDVLVLPTPTIKGSVVYGIVTGIAPLPSGASVWAGFAVDLLVPSTPAIKWYTEVYEGTPNPVPIQLTSRLVYISDTAVRRFRAFLIGTGELFWWYYGDRGVQKVARGVTVLSPWTATQNELAIIQGANPTDGSSFVWEQAMNINGTTPSWLIPGVNF